MFIRYLKIFLINARCNLKGMYEEYFGFLEKPFNVTPDAHFLYPSVQHEGVINTLYYGIRERKGFLLLTGEVGTGKTTSLRAVLNRMGDDIETSLIINPLLSTVELLKTMNKDFGCDTPGDTVKEQLDALNYFVLENNKEGRNAVVIIDEAQNLSFEALEMTRLLSNLETSTHKLLQIILVGQPELQDKLSDKSLRQLVQRIQIFCQLKAFDTPQTEEYIQHRIQRAGNNPMIAFERKALREIHKISGGIPRMINTLCEMTLLTAYAHETRVVTRGLVKEAAREVPYYVLNS